MTIDNKYGILFKVELLHKYFTDTLCPDFSIRPSALTANVLSGHKIISKQYNNTLYTGLQANAAGIPFHLPESDMQLTFFLQLNNPLFFNYTNLPSSSPAGKIYYFTNRNNNMANGKKFLSAPILPYSSSSTYKPGDIAASGSGVVFEAIRSSNSGSPFDLSKTDYWMQVDMNAYMSEADALQWLPSVSLYSFTTPQSSANIKVFGYNPATDDYSATALSKNILFANPVAAFQLDLSTMNPGKYKLTINGIDKWIYINDELQTTKTFAVIDIFNDPSLAAAYQMLNGTTLLQPLYSVYFLNRATIWKYVLPSLTGASLIDNDSVYNFVNLPNGVFSASPIPLSDRALNLQLTVGGQDHLPIACATPERLANQAQNGDTYYCSEIFLNY